jgi:tetratricopeptide (TPR) repeat protein
MRAARIPTRLVAGMKLNPGGMWGYHMWNTYWNGDDWRAIDPSTMSYRPGAVYVALGRGTARFADIRDRLADFMWATFRRVSIDLIKASNSGEELFLARPKSPDQNLKQTALFNAVVLSERGDHKGAIKILDDNIPFDRSSLSVKLMRIELLVLDGRHAEALQVIRVLRNQTSDNQNVNLLNEFEFKCLLKMGERQSAQDIYKHIDKELEKRGREVERILLKAEFLFALEKQEEAIALLEDALKTHPSSTPIHTAFSEYVSSSTSKRDPAKLEKALLTARFSVEQTLGADHRSLTALARLHFLLGQPGKALRLVDHALILAPAERNLHDLRAQLMSAHCFEN